MMEMWWFIVGDGSLLEMAHCWRWLIVGDGSLLEMWWFNDGDVMVHCWRWLIVEDMMAQ